MTLKSISNPGVFKVLNRVTNERHYGCDQEWYSTEWQRRSGCGPTAASNIIYYLTHKGQTAKSEQDIVCKSECSSLMEEVWNHVTPTTEGIPTTKMLCEEMLSYIKSKGLEFEYRLMDIPKDSDRRPKLLEVLDFLETALSEDVPVAFLNLCNGDEINLERWHWVTIISLEYTDKDEQICIDILDEGLIKKIDLTLWYNTTKRGGGFVYFSVPDSIRDINS